MKCPRDQTELVVDQFLNIEVDHCPTCNGRWLDLNELDQLESTTGATEAERRADLAHHIALKQAIDRAAGAFLATTDR